MKLVVYGTLRKGEALSNVLPKNKKCEIIELPGVQLYHLGGCPGAKLCSRENKSVVELCEFDLTKKDETKLLKKLDLIEGVYIGLYERNSINTPKGEATIYTIRGNVERFPKIKDWKNRQKKNKNEYIKIL